MHWKWILSIFAVITVALIVTVFALLTTYDFNKFKPIIIRAVKDATGRELKIAGDIDLKIGFTPALVMEGVSLENATWGSRPQMVRIKLLEVQVVLLPLIRGVLEVKRLIVIEPDILVETNNTGKSNLDFDNVDKTGIIKPEENIRDKTMNLPALAFKDVRIEEGRITYRLGQSGKTHIAILNTFTASANGLYSPVELDLNGKYNGKSFRLAGTSGSLVDVINSSKVCPLDLTARIGTTVIKINGSVRDIMHVRGLALNITAEVRSIKEVARLVYPGLGARRTEEKRQK
ncbi:MAG: AsmA family protein [Thermodesulfobacteriota bacterium]|nr:AsmA family protein [Thermodesulfobacteriota bacterium]